MLVIAKKKKETEKENGLRVINKAAVHNKNEPKQSVNFHS